MSEVIDFKSKTTLSASTLKNPLSVELLKELSSNADVFQDLVVFFKKNDGTVGLIDTNPTIEDKSLFLQMLQHQIVCFLDRNRAPIDFTEVASNDEEDL